MDNIETLFVFMSWAGVVFLLVAHFSIAIGIKKSTASRVSAIGAVIALIAALGMEIWSVFALNLAWMVISIWGSHIPERMTPSRRADIGLIALSALSFPIWIGGAEDVAWFATAFYVCSWVAFSAGAVTRASYLCACVLVGAAVTPALWHLGAHAFAFNEAVGVLVGIYGLRRELPLFGVWVDRSKNLQKPRSETPKRA